jgi:mRNA interferase MazF
LNRVQVVPLTTNVERVYPSEAVVHVKGRKNKAMADQVTTAAKSRLVRSEGPLESRDPSALDRAIALQLGLHLPQSDEAPSPPSGR